MRNIILAFPGMGKTTLAQKDGQYADLDYGTFRTAMGVKHDQPQQRVIAEFLKKANPIADSGKTILSNDYALIPALKKAGYNIEMVLPSNIPALVKRVADRNGDDGLWGGSFISELKKNSVRWVHDWADAARAYGVNVKYGLFLEEVI